MAYSLNTVIQLFRTSFSSFFCNISEDVKKAKDHDNRWVIDNTNNTISMHYFSKDTPLEDCQREFIIKMQRRYNRMHDKLQTSQAIMLVCNRKDNIRKLKKFLFNFSALYPNLYITLMNIRNNSHMNNTDICIKKINLLDKLTIIEHTFNDSIDCNTGKKYSWTGNDALWSNVLSGYCLSDNKNTLEN